MLNIFIIILTGIVFAMCTALMLFMAINSVLFRKKIAIPHSFSEGILTGPIFPALIASYAFIFIQFASFIVFKAPHETILTLRLIIFALSTLAFAVFKILTPPLLALWFGKSAFWDSKGTNGKNLYSDIYCAKVHAQKNTHFINNQQLYRISFYVKNQNAFLLPRKYSCKMTAKQISALTPYINFKSENEKPSVPKRALIYAACLPVLIFGIVLTTFMMTVSTGVLNEQKYQSGSAKLDDEIPTVTNISDICTDGKYIYVFYENITSVNVYDTDGKHVYSVSLEPSVFKHSEIGIASSGDLLYHIGDQILYYSEGKLTKTVQYGDQYENYFKDKKIKIGQAEFSFDEFNVYRTENGQTTPFIESPAYLVLFSPVLLWPVTFILIVALFLLRYFADPKKSKSADQTKQ